MTKYWADTLRSPERLSLKCIDFVINHSISYLMLETQVHMHPVNLVYYQGVIIHNNLNHVNSLGNISAIVSLIRSPAKEKKMIQLKKTHTLSGLIFCLIPFCNALADDATTLTNAEPTTGLSGSTNSKQYFKIEVPANATNLVIKTSGGDGDVDLYVKAGQQPTLNSYDCRPSQTGNNESCDNLTKTDTTYYIMLHGYYDYSGVTLSASYSQDSQGNSAASESEGGSSSNSDSSEQTTGDCEMTAVQSELLAAHNEARSQGRNCGDTYYPAVPALTWNCKLASAAAAHDQDMAANNIFSHTGSDGSQIWDRITDAGYTPSYWGENIAAGYSTVDQVMQVWLESSGHCSNIMSENFTEMGADKLTTSGAAYPVYWTTDFGRP
jgi:uncharacterized protein YkwD